MARKVLTPEERLSRRIQREFERKKFLGDIAVSDEEYLILLAHLKEKFAWLKRLKLKDINDRQLCVALVQIGIRCYDGAFWPHVAKAVGLAKLSIQDQEMLGKSFFRTMNVRQKFVLTESDRVSAILMQGFVCDRYAPQFFDFLYAFYNIDLERDLTRLDRDTMQELIEIMQRTDNTGRTYQLVEQTANAVRLHPRGAKTRIRRYLRLIDRAFWNEPLPEQSQNRLIRRFLEWASDSEDIRTARRSHQNGAGRKKLFSSPYYKLNKTDLSTKLVLPPQHIRFGEDAALCWEIRIGERKETLPINPYVQGVTGYTTEQVDISLDDLDLLQAYTIRLLNGDKILRSFSMKASCVRFFDADGISVSVENLQPGIAFSLSELSCQIYSESIQTERKQGMLRFNSYLLQDSDLICFSDMPPVAVGTKITNGLMLRNCVSGVRYLSDDGSCPVYSSYPTMILTLEPHRAAGTAIIVNGTKYPLMRDGAPVKGVTQFPVQNGTDSVGFMFNSAAFGCLENGAYTITVDAPGRNSISTYSFLLLHGFRYHFEDAPYLFRTHGTVCLPPAFRLDGLRADRTDDMLAYQIELNPDSGVFPCNTLGYALEIDIPVLRYRFAGDQWRIAQHVDVWHAQFQPLLEIAFPGSQITFSLDDYADDPDDDDDHEITVRKTVSDGLFHCDLTPFRSWFGRQSARRTIFVQGADMERKTAFLGVVTKSILFSGTLQAEEGKLTGHFQICGFSEYFADLYFGSECIAEKVPVRDGMISVDTRLRTGTYSAAVFEAEDDEFGFGDAYYEIGRRELAVVDPSDLSGKSVRIRHIQPADEPESCLSLFYKYKVVGLQKLGPDSDTYSGKMIVKTPAGTLKATFEVLLTIPDHTEPCAGYLEFDDDGDRTGLIYDSVERSIVKYADRRKGKAVIYRRYDPVLWAEDYIYRLDYVTASEEELSCNADETEYNNLKYH